VSIRRVTQLHTQAPWRTDGHDTDGTPGDCYRAAIASLFALPAEEVPHFGLYLSWWDETRRWLHGRDRDLAYVEPGDDLHKLWCELEHATPVLVGGRSPRGAFGHVVVGFVDGTVLWDPHPSRAGLRTVDEFFLPVAPYGHLRDRLALAAA